METEVSWCAPECEQENEQDSRKTELVELIPRVPSSMKKYFFRITLVVDDIGHAVEKHVVTHICDGTNGEKVAFQPRNVQNLGNIFILIDKNAAMASDRKVIATSNNYRVNATSSLWQYHETQHFLQ